MSKTHHLLKRNGVWYYRRRVPAHLVSDYGKPFIQFSLETSSPKEAQRRRNIWDVEYDARFGARDTISPQEPHARLTRADVEARIKEYVRVELGKFDARYLENPATSAAEFQDIVREKEISLQILGHNEHPDQDRQVHQLFKRIIGDNGLDGIGEVAVAKLVTDGLQALLLDEIAILHGERNPFRVGTSTSRADTPVERVPTFGQIANEYLKEELEKALANRRRPQWIEKQTSQISVLIDLVGSEALINSVDYDLSRKVQSQIAKLPAHREKRFRGLALDDAITEGVKRSASLLGPATQSQYLKSLENILSLALAKGYIRTNPARGLRPLIRDQRSAFEKRRPFSLAQIKQFFASPFYDHFRPGALKLYTKPDRDWRFWLPLMKLFMGLRPGEICQLDLVDIRQSPAGFWVVDVTATEDNEPDGKRLKTKSSKRSFPVHPSLIEIGFLDFVNWRKQETNGVKLFNNLKPSRRGYYSDYANRRFREAFLPQSIDMEKDQSLYSFRHSFRDGVRRAGAPSDVLSSFGGWSQGSRVSDSYGDKSDPEYLLRYVAATNYPGVSLDFHWAPMRQVTESPKKSRNAQPKLLEIPPVQD